MAKSQFRVIGKRITRIDAKDKVTGKLIYPSDYYSDDMLWGKVLRSKYPHAKIKSINTSRAEKLKGVIAVLTHKDIEGSNRYGIAIQDQPVLCEDKVRYVGDAVAVVAGETKEIAEKAIELIEVDYEPLPLITNVHNALKSDAIKIHNKGNIILELHFNRGDVGQGFKECDLIVENTYFTPMMDHTFLETEAGFAKIDSDGNVTVWAGGQYPFRDQTQIARTLGYPMEKIRMIEPFTGGAFGGKDEITCQILLALLAIKTKRPVKMWFTREEHMISGTHRHPLEIKMKTGVKKDGKLIAHTIEAYQDGGAYASLSGPVLNLVIEHGVGIYNVPNFKADGYCVYTNNGLSGAFRGFGNTQSCVAIESQMSRIAEALGMDELELRYMNAIEKGDTVSIGFKMELSAGIKETIKSAKESKVWKNRKKIIDDFNKRHRFIKRGIGVAASMQGSGLGAGLPDYASTSIELKSDGKFYVGSGNIDIGQGVYTGILQVIAEELKTDVDKLVLIGADTAKVLDSGTTTASRVMYAAGNSSIKASRQLINILKRKAVELLDNVGTYHDTPLQLMYDGEKIFDKRNKNVSISLIDIARKSKNGELISKASFIMPVSKQMYNEGLPHILFSNNTNIAIVDVDILTGEIKVQEAYAFLDCGTVINPINVEGQSEGGIVMGLGYALYEECKLENGYFLNPNLSTYIVPTAIEMPEIKTKNIVVEEETGPYGAKSVAEIVTVPIAPAIMNAIHSATGVWFNKIPITPEAVIEKISL